MSDGARGVSPKLTDARDDVFRAFGRVAYAVQIFESDLITLLLLLELITHVEHSAKTEPELFLTRKAVERWWQTESGSIEKELDRCTLGKLLNERLREARKSLESLSKDSGKVISDEYIASITGELNDLPIEEWTTALDNRNYLFHRFWYHADDKLSDIKDCQELQISLRRYQEEFDGHVQRVREALQVIAKVLGYEQILDWG